MYENSKVARLMVDVLIQTHNEEPNLPHALKSVTGWVNRVFVLDSGSTDRTCEIARQMGATVVHHAWEGYARQKNWALDNLPWEAGWILIIDADESITPELEREISEIVTRPIESVEQNAFYLNRLLIFMGRGIRHCGYFPSWNCRLIKRGFARYEDRLVHEHMIVDGPSGYLKHLMLHEDRRGMEHFAAKHNRYSSLEAREIYEAPEPWPGLKGFFTDRIKRRRYGKSRILPYLPVSWVWRFLYMYFIRLGFLDGLPGWHLCNFIASYELSIQLKVRELRRLHGRHASTSGGLSEPEGSPIYSESRPSDRLTSSSTVQTKMHGAVPARPEMPATDSSVSIPTRKLDSEQVQHFTSPWTFQDNLWRAAWMITRPVLFGMSFHNWYGWRAMILRAFGAKVGRHVRVRPSAKIEIPWNLELGDGAVIGDDAIIYSLGKITIGRNVVVSQYAHLCAGTHDFHDPSFPLLKPPITIHDGAWIAADAFVGPGVVIGPGTVVGARSSVFKDLPANVIAVGNPAKPIKELDRGGPRTTEEIEYASNPTAPRDAPAPNHDQPDDTTGNVSTLPNETPTAPARV